MFGQVLLGRSDVAGWGAFIKVRNQRYSVIFRFGCLDLTKCLVVAERCE